MWPLQNIMWGSNRLSKLENPRHPPHPPHPSYPLSSIHTSQVTLDISRSPIDFQWSSWREREIKFIGLFENRGHRGPYSPYKPFNHNLYIGIIIFPHIDNPQYTGYDLPKKKPNKIINDKRPVGLSSFVNCPPVVASFLTQRQLSINAGWQHMGRVPHPNYVDPECCVATVCHQVRFMYWEHLGHFQRAISHLSDIKLFVWDI